MTRPLSRYNPLTACSVASARKMGHTPAYLRQRADIFRRRAADYATERARENALALAHHFEQVAAALESTPEES